MATQKRLIVCPVCGTEKLTVGVTCSIRCSREFFPQKTKHPDPTQEEIDAIKKEIQAKWTEAEERHRAGNGGTAAVEIKILATLAVTRRGFDVNHGE